MAGYFLAAIGFGLAVFLLWMALKRRDSSKRRQAVYFCTHCGENDCVCHQKDPSTDN